MYDQGLTMNQTKIIIDNQSINQYCLNVLDIQQIFKEPDHWPGPFPPESSEKDEQKLKEKREALVSAICQRFPTDYVDRLLFTHGLQIIVNRFLFPWINLFSDDLLYFEGILHMESQEAYYRDHYVHPLEVGCIGEQLLCEVRIGKKTLGEIILNSFKRIAAGKTPGKEPSITEKYFRQCNISPDDITKEWLKASWWLAALYHDIGYFAQKSGHLFEQRLSRSFPFGWNRLLANWNKQEMGDELVWHQVETWMKQVELFNNFRTEELLALITEKDHPGIGAITLSALSRKLLQYKPVSPAIFTAFQTASHAILCHDHMGLAKYLRTLSGEKSEAPLFHLKYWDNPLAALLVICDHISEFNRERLMPAETGARKICFESKSLWERVEIITNGKDRCIHIHYKPGKRKKKDNTSDNSGKRKKDNASDASDKFFKKDKRWFLPCIPLNDNDDNDQKNQKPPPPYLKLAKNVFDVLVHLDTSDIHDAKL